MISCPALHVLIERFSKQRKKDLVSFLDSDTQKKVFEDPVFVPEKFVEHFKYKNILSNIHISWCIDILERYSKDELPWMLSIFSDEPRMFCKKHFKVDIPLTSSFAKTFFTRRFCMDFFKSHSFSVPAECLPKRDLSVLIDFDYDKLIKLIELLAMFDFKHAIRQVVDKNMIRKIMSFINHDELLFLQHIAKEQDLYPQKINILNEWDANQSLRNLLHATGINRLSLALNDLKLYIALKLDKKRGTRLLMAEKIPRMMQSMTECVLYVIRYIDEKQKK